MGGVCGLRSAFAKEDVYHRGHREDAVHFAKARERAQVLRLFGYRLTATQDDNCCLKPAGSVGAEVEDDDFFGLLGRGFPLAFADGVDRGLCENGMSADDRGGLDAAVGCDDGFDPHRAGDSHAARQARISRLRTADKFARALGVVLLRGRARNSQSDRDCEERDGE